MSKAIRVLAISDADLDVGNAADPIRVFNQAVAVPKHARALRGCIVFEFARFDNDPRPNFIIPEVRRYTQLIDQAHPYFCYFLPEPAATTQVYSWLMSLASPIEPIAPNATGIIVDECDFLDLIMTRIAAVQSLCDRIFDDASITEKAIMDALPKNIAAAVAAKVSGSRPK